MNPIIVQRFLKRVNFAGPLPTERPELGPCWIWEGGKRFKGYGVFFDGTRAVQAHRFSYECIFGPIEGESQADHLCFTTNCVNPLHIELVDRATNILRGRSFCAVNSRKTHCNYGHAFDDTNTHIGPSGERVCIACRQRRRREARMRKLARQAELQTRTPQSTSL